MADPVSFSMIRRPDIEEPAAMTAGDLARMISKAS